MSSPDTPGDPGTPAPAPAHDPLPPYDPSMSVGDIDLQGKKSPVKTIVFAILGVVVVGGGGFAAYRMATGHSTAKMHAAFMEEFQHVEKDEFAPFWACVFGANIDPGMFPDNLALGQRIEGMFNGDPLHYPEKLTEDCIPKLEQASSKARSLSGPPEYEEALAEYKKKLPPLGDGLTEFATRSKTRGAAKEFERKVQAAANAFHTVEGAPPPEAIAYDKYLRCAIPDIDKLKDSQALLERLFEQCKKPEFIEGIRKNCATTVNSTEVKPDAKFKATLKKFGPDDRDASAWEDCYRKSRKGEKRDDLAAFGKAWVEYMEAGAKVRKIGADKLKESQ